ncbi:MAG: glycosyltransferase [Lachnospiraceae bacterium]|nr:glycosyltransferase [Lachnospiraceae bacterium]
MKSLIEDLLTFCITLITQDENNNRECAMTDFSFCIITKNEEKKIARCLEPLKATGMEVIVLDTGSTDDTVSVAQNYTDKIYHFDWINDFSAARNYAMTKASHDHILFLDADEYVEEIDIPAIKKLLRKYPDVIGQIKRRNACFASDGISEKISIDLVERLFDRRLYHYTGTIHEQITHRQGKMLYAYQIPLTVYHDGYLGTPEERRQKAERNNALLFEELKKSPEDPYLYYQIGQSFGLCSDAEQEYEYYHKGCSLPLDTSLSYVRIMLVSYGYSMLHTHRETQAMQLAAYYDQLSSYADYVCLLGCIYLENHEHLKAIRAFRHALTLTEYYIEGSNNATPWHNLGCIYEALGNVEEALLCYEHAMTYHSPITKERYDALMQRKNEHSKNVLPDPKDIAAIIPCHNASNLLDGFFKSLEEQTMGLTHVQLIFLDFASNDDTWDKLNIFEQKYPDSVMLFPFSPDTAPTDLRTPEDCIAYGIAENLLASYITAPYVCFLQPKDRLNMDLLRQYKQIFSSNPCDAVICLTVSEIEDSDHFATQINPNASCSLLQISNDQARAELAASPLFDLPLSGKLFSKSYLENSHLWAQINSEEKNQADRFLKVRVCQSIHTICYLADTLYYS